MIPLEIIQLCITFILSKVKGTVISTPVTPTTYGNAFGNIITVSHNIQSLVGHGRLFITR